MFITPETAPSPHGNVAGRVFIQKGPKYPVGHEHFDAEPIPTHKSVIGDGSSEAPKRQDEAAGKKRAKAGSRRTRKPKKRGPKGSNTLKWEQVIEIDHLAHVARREGLELNYCLTIRAPQGVPDGEGKRSINDYRKRISEALTGRGQEWVAVWCYEKQPHLHAHALMHVARGNLGLLKEHVKRSGRDLKITKADAGGPEYITKQRCPRKPEIERINPRRRIKGAYIDGPRVGYSKPAKALLDRFPPAKRWDRPADPQKIRPLPPEPPRPAAQFGLPLDWKPSRPTTDAALMAQFLDVFGYTQEQAAKRLGYRDRSHVANILRGHDGMSPARRKWVEYLLETGLVETRLAA